MVLTRVVGNDWLHIQVGKRKPQSDRRDIPALLKLIH